MKLTRELPPPSEIPDHIQDRDLVRQEALNNIQLFKSAASRGLWALALFITVSIGALWDFSFFPSLPPAIRALLGRPPSATMISSALVLYTFSAIILIFSRMMSGSGSYSGLSHVGYLAAFYTFYHFARTLDENFWAVFVAGLAVLSLESYHIWNYCSDAIRKEQEVLDAIEKKKNWP